MNISLLTSFVIGGMLLLSLLYFNNSVLNSTVETTMTVSSQTKIDTIVEILENDISRLGYNTGTADNFITHQSNVLKFKGDIFDGDEVKDLDYDEVEWRLTSTKAGNTTNPNDYILKRTWDPDPLVAGNEEVTEFYVSRLEFKYYTAQGAVTNDRSVIKQIEIELIYEADEPYYTNSNGSPQYYRTIWQRTIVPNNLTF
ncbi:MAG: hypothetical protein JXR20_06720 [Balneola sp.]